MSNLLKTFSLILSFLIICFLTSRYVTINSDVANSSLIWRELLDGNLHVYRDWKPTVDSWYFSVYPLHFILFYVFGSDTLFPIIIATSLFTFIVAASCSEIAGRLFGTASYFFTLIVLTVLPYPLYNWGLVQHPFSHYSTTAYGFICILVTLLNFSKGSVTGFLIICLLSLMACISDPWYAPTFLLPILLSEIFRLYKKRKNAVIAILMYAITFLVFMSHAIQNLFNIPIHNFKLVPLHQMLANMESIPVLIGRSFNFLMIDHVAAHITCFLIFSALTVKAFFDFTKKGEKYSYASILFSLSILGIISSFILSNRVIMNQNIRFFLNVYPIIYISLSYYLTTMPILLKISATILFGLVNSITYFGTQPSANIEIKKIDKYTDFLISHHLKNGLGPFWKYSMPVNWLYPNKIHITPVIFDETGDFLRNRGRVQTMAHWLGGDFTKKIGGYDFITLTEGRKGLDGECPEIDKCKRAIESAYGKPDEQLFYEGMLILVYRKGIQP